MIWDANIKGIMLSYSDLKIRNKLAEIIEEQDYINVPVKYKAIYFNFNLDKEEGCSLCINYII